jgi:3-hydroxybutyrate dehydrogenase
MSVKNKVLFITGAASGIGFEIARQFAKEGAKLVITDLNAGKITQAVS